MLPHFVLKIYISFYFSTILPHGQGLSSCIIGLFSQDFILMDYVYLCYNCKVNMGGSIRKFYKDYKEGRSLP